MKQRELPEIRLDKTKIAVVPIDDDSDEIDTGRLRPSRSAFSTSKDSEE